MCTSTDIDRPHQRRQTLWGHDLRRAGVKMLAEQPTPFVERNRGADHRHGTVSGAKRHSDAGELPCDSCRAAKAKYDKRLRSTPDKIRRNRIHARAQAKAETDLRRAHPEEYRAAYVAYRDLMLAEAGL